MNNHITSDAKGRDPLYIIPVTGVNNVLTLYNVSNQTLTVDFKKIELNDINSIRICHHSKYLEGEISEDDLLDINGPYHHYENKIYCFNGDFNEILTHSKFNHEELKVKVIERNKIRLQNMKFDYCYYDPSSNTFIKQCSYCANDRCPYGHMIPSTQTPDVLMNPGFLYENKLIDVDEYNMILKYKISVEKLSKINKIDSKGYYNNLKSTIINLDSIKNLHQILYQNDKILFNPKLHSVINNKDKYLEYKKYLEIKEINLKRLIEIGEPQTDDEIVEKFRLEKFNNQIFPEVFINASLLWKYNVKDNVNSIKL